MANYTLAGFETLPNYYRKQTHLTSQEVNWFFKKTCRKYLRSFGQNFKGNLKTHIRDEVKLLVNCKSDGIYDDCILIIDSGGFQISINKVAKSDIPGFMALYYDDFLIKYHHLFNRAFVMDIPPGPGCEAFDDFDDLYKLNEESYLKAAQLPKEVRDKMVYIHHFRTPELWRIFMKILRENDYFKEYQYHGTGGLVANMSSDVQIPCIMPMLPLVPLLNDAKKCGRNSIDFHVLGGSTMRDVLFYQIFQIHLKKVHGIDINIGYDSSGLYKGVMMGRTIPILNGYNIHKLDLRESKLDFRFMNSETIRDRFKHIMTDMCEDVGFKKLPEQELDDIYYTQIDKRKNGTIKETRTFIPNVRMYIALYYLYSYTKAEERFKALARGLYPVYESGEVGEFNRQLEEVTRAINFGKITRKQKAKTYSVAKTLDLLTSLDEDYCENLVKKHLAKDEFSDLDPNAQVMTV